MTARIRAPGVECDRCGKPFPVPANGWDLYYDGRCPTCKAEVPTKHLNRAARERRAAAQSQR